MSKIKGITYAAVSSSTFGVAPCFTLLLLGNGYIPFEVLSYRWGIASLCMILWGLSFRHDFQLKREEWGTVLGFTLTSVLGAMEPLTAVLIGIILFHELFTFQGGLGIVFIIAAVTLVVLYDKKQ